MRLTAKLMLVFFAVVILMTAVSSYVAVWHGFQRLQQQQITHADRMAGRLQQDLQRAWRERGPRGIFEILQRDASWQHVRVRWVWFDPGADAAHRPAVPVDQLAGALRGDMITVTTRDSSGGRHLRTYCPIEIGSDRRGGLELTESLQPLDTQAQVTLLAGLASIGLMAVAGVLVSWLAGMRWVARPLERLIDKTRRVGQGDLDGPLELGGGDELSQLAAALNDMCLQLREQQQQIHRESSERLGAMEQLRHADRLKTVGRLAAGIAHELGTPLNVVSGRAGLIASGKLDAEEVQRSAQTIKAEADRITHIVRQLLDFARRRSPQRNRVDLRDIARQTAQLLEPLAAKRNVVLQVLDDGDPVTACIDLVRIQQVVANLVMNAIQAMEQGGEVRIGAGYKVPAGDGDGEGGRRCAYLAVEDQGVGIPEQHLPHIFEPFYTTKQVGEGTGLGLSIATGIVQEHNGWIDVDSRPGRGSRFTVFVPEEPEPCADES
jgi:two-component system, NtrC family, sensor kinase